MRVQADWPRIQAQADQWDIHWLDHCIRDARKAGFTVILVFGPTPAWAASYLPHSDTAALARAHPDLPAFRHYVTRVTRRYLHKVAFYQVWERPAVSSLLATQRDVFALFRTATKAVHSVDPLLPVILPEPGDVDICWIAGYFKHAQHLETPDILLLSPVQFTLHPQVFWWRVPALRKYVFTTRQEPILWSQIPLHGSTTDTAFTTATASLLDGIPTTIFTVTSANDLNDPRLAAGIRTIASLRGSTYAGWTLLDNDTPAGIFRRGATTRTLALPLADDHLHFTPDDYPLFSDSVAIPAGKVTTTTLGEAPQTVQVADNTTWVPAAHPTLFSGLSVLPMAGTPEIRLPEISSAEVSLDVAGSDPSGLHLLRDLRGGQFCQQSIDGRTVISTVADTAPWIHVKMPDSFLFFNPAHLAVDVTVDVLGSAQREHCGFDLYYDAQDDMRYTHWQWIDVGPDQVFSYTFRLNDVLFSNRSGYDFRINMGGSTENVRVVDIHVRKIESADR